jgi:hypothetical protein
VEEKSKDGFTQVMGRRKQPQKKPSQGVGKNIPTNNSFDALNHLPDAEEVENPHKPDNPHIDKGKSKQSLDPVLEKIITPSSPAQLDPEKDSDEGGDTIMHMDERELADIDLEKLEDAFNKKELQSIPVEQLRKVHKVFIDSTTGATSRLGISSDPGLGPQTNA